MDVSHIVPNDVRDPRSEPGLIIDIDLSTADPVREPWTRRFVFVQSRWGRGCPLTLYAGSMNDAVGLSIERPAPKQSAVGSGASLHDVFVRDPRIHLMALGTDRPGISRPRFCVPGGHAMPFANSHLADSPQRWAARCS